MWNLREQQPEPEVVIVDRLEEHLPLTDYQMELLEVLDLARAGHYQSIRMMENFFYHLDKILGPFGDDVFTAAHNFVETLDA